MNIYIYTHVHIHNTNIHINNFLYRILYRIPYPQNLVQLEVFKESIFYVKSWSFLGKLSLLNRAQNSPVLNMFESFIILSTLV